MLIPIWKATPSLNAEERKIFLTQIEANENKKKSLNLEQATKKVEDKIRKVKDKENHLLDVETDTFYVIVECGHEGTQKIFFISADKQETIDKIKEIRTKAKPIKWHLNNIVDKLDKMSYKECMKTYKYDYKADDVCVFAWNKKESRYSCVCSQLGVSLSKSKLY